MKSKIGVEESNLVTLQDTGIGALENRKWTRGSSPFSHLSHPTKG